MAACVVVLPTLPAGTVFAGEGADCCDTHMRPLAKRYAFIAI